jgi:hypothetical protein
MKIENSSQPEMSAAAISERLKTLRREAPNAPKGLPKQQPNQDDTRPLYPTIHQSPTDRLWDPRTMITGSGNGPEMGGPFSSARGQ